MSKLSTIFKTLAIICILSIIPVSTAMASSTSTVQQGATSTGKIMVPTNTSNNLSNAISPDSVGYGDGGYVTVNAYDLNYHDMEIDWTLTSTSQPITYVNVTTTFDDGYPVNQSYSTLPSYNVGNVVQHGFSTSGYHSGTVSGWGYMNFSLLDFTISPTTAGTNIR